MGTINGRSLKSGTAAPTAARAGLMACHDCRLLARMIADPKGHAHCPRCGAPLHWRKPDSMTLSLVLLITAIILYVPANVLPIMHTTYLGKTQSDTILSGVIYFMTTGSWHIAIIIFVASIVVPALKLIVLAYLLISVKQHATSRREERTRFYRIIESIGRWSMVDIYVVTVMVALMNLGVLASVEAGWGAFYFGAVVVITMFAVRSFDPRLIWDEMENQR
ncbi:MAG: paraquat-inducible protein A [Desulfatitalea sp. BRH_c12]|nr:MAG: paraquat-inducible protein A [Desulfatitalea sp. BRH_c12]